MLQNIVRNTIIAFLVGIILLLLLFGTTRGPTGAPGKFRINDDTRLKLPPQPVPQSALDYMSRNNTKGVTVITWEYPSHWAGWGPNPSHHWAGYTVKRPVCPIDCLFTGEQERAPTADAVIFEAQPFGKRGSPWPDVKPEGQKWIFFTYETNRYFPIQSNWFTYLIHMDWKVMYETDSDLRVSLSCDWGYDPSQYLAPPPAKDPKMMAVFVASNCGAGGATHRTAYVRELMEYIDVDSYGLCLQNVPQDNFNRNTAKERFTSKINQFSKYMFVLAFENSNVTDYVTEKLTHAYLAGSIPVYMGAPNVEDYTPGENSLIRTDKFPNPRALASHLLFLSKNPDEYAKYFEWKKQGLKESFKETLRNCVFYAECRMCQRLAAIRDGHMVEVPWTRHVTEFMMGGDGGPHIFGFTPFWFLAFIACWSALLTVCLRCMCACCCRSKRPPMPKDNE